MYYYISDKTFDLKDYVKISHPSTLNSVPKGAEVYLVGRIPLNMDVPDFWDILRTRSITLRQIKPV